MQGHGGALDYDLMTMTRFTLDDLGGALSTRALLHFCKHLPPTSALARELHPENAERVAWMRGDASAQLLAVLIDEVRGLAWSYASHEERRRLPRPRRFPTPWAPDTATEGTHLGSDPMPLSEFDAWWGT